MSLPSWRLLGLVLLLPAGCATDDQPALDVGVDLSVPDVDTPDGHQGPRSILLPEDESPHSDEMEWWYYTGRLQGDGGEVFGFELTVFQMIFADKPLYISHFAVTDLQTGLYHSDMQVETEDQRALGPGFTLKVGSIEMTGHGGQHRLRATTKDAAIELALGAEKPPVLHYGTGWMNVAADDPFYYYSYTRMAASGRISVEGVSRKVTGEAWMDHQWGTIGTGFGWDWFSLRLDDRTEVMLFRVRREGKLGFVGGTIIDDQGGWQPLKADAFDAVATGRWTSPHTGVTYTNGWRVTVPALQLDVQVVPMVQDQEFALTLFGSPIYWEGLCDVTGTRAGKAATGHAYVEITGDMSKM